jgi:hypothetical protein
MADAQFADIVAKFKEHEIPLSQDDMWSIQGNRVLKHRALERLAAKLKIRFDEPRIVRAERDECVMIVVGRLGEYSDWSMGEAQPKNCKNAYPFAMAEKRARDRVIIKLVGLEAYSEAEADEFRENAESPPLPGATPVSHRLRRSMRSVCRAWKASLLLVRP